MCGAPFEMMQTSFFLSRQTLIAVEASPAWRSGARSCSRGCCAMRRRAMEFFRLPTNRVVELGSQVEI